MAVHAFSWASVGGNSVKAVINSKVVPYVKNDCKGTNREMTFAK